MGGSAWFICACRAVRPVSHRWVLVSGGAVDLGAGDARVCAVGALAAGRVAGAAVGWVADVGAVGAERKSVV